VVGTERKKEFMSDIVVFVVVKPRCSLRQSKEILTRSLLMSESFTIIIKSIIKNKNNNNEDKKERESRKRHNATTTIATRL